MKKPKKVYVVLRPGNNNFELGINVYEDFEKAKEIWEERNGKPYEKNEVKENGCFLIPTYLNS